MAHFPSVLEHPFGGGFAMVMVSGCWTNSTLQQQSYSLLTGGGLVPQKAVCRIQPRALDVIQEGERSHGVQNSPSFEFGDLARSSRSQRVVKPRELTNPFARNILNTSTCPLRPYPNKTLPPIAQELLTLERRGSIAIPRQICPWRIAFESGSERDPYFVQE